MRKRVIIESPYRASDTFSMEQHQDYYDLCIQDCLERGEAPFGGHFYYTNVLNDNDPRERDIGFECHFSWMAMADVVAVYGDMFISPGMKQGIEYAKSIGKLVEWRSVRDFERVNKIKGL